jgi:hypothetical protein
MSLSDLVHTEARKMGVSGSNASRALKMMKKGKLDMSKIAPQIKDMFMKNNSFAQSSMTLKERLKAKISSKNEIRRSHVSKRVSHDKTRERMQVRDEQKKKDKENLIRLQRNRRKRHNKKLKILSKKLGEISVIMYNKCQEKLLSDETTDEEKKNCNNIVELYQRQQKFSKNIEKNDLDILLDDNDDLSDLSDMDE